MLRRKIKQGEGHIMTSKCHLAITISEKELFPDVSVYSRETSFPCTASTFKPRINSHHGGTWDSPVG